MDNLARLLELLSEMSIGELELMLLFTEWLAKEQGGAEYQAVLWGDIRN